MQCRLCPVECGADRKIRAGACGVKGLSLAKAYLHPFEEPCLSPGGKSGAVFFSGCSLRCVFCQNFELSHAARGKRIFPKELAEIFLRLEEEGAENIDLVTPDHFIPEIVEAFTFYRPKVPVVFNSGGYVKTEALSLIAPFIDIWMPDFKFASEALAARLTGRKNYPSIAREAVSFMAQTPVVWEGETLRSGILVRHLVLPSHTEDSKRVLDILRGILPEAAPLSLMRQYTPMGEIAAFPELARRVTDREYSRVVEYALALSFPLYTQEKESADPAFIPKWDY